MFKLLKASNLVFRYSHVKLKRDIHNLANPEKMSRYFVNEARDYDGEEFVVDYKQIKQDVMNNIYRSVEQQKKTQKGIDGGLYVGTIGNAYTLYHLSRKTRFSGERNDLLNAALDVVNCAVRTSMSKRSRDPSDECGFLLGKAGIYALGAAVYLELALEQEAADCIREFINAGKYCEPLSYSSFGGDELFVGRAGYLCGALWLNKVFNKQIIPEHFMEKICFTIIQSGTEFGRSHNSKSPLMFSYYNVEYLGAAHGLSSILQMLLCCDFFIKKNPNVERVIKSSIDFLLSTQTPDGNFPPDTESIGDSKLVHWCHGASGVVYLMIKAYLVWHEPRYLDSAVKCGEVVWEKGLLKKGPGICHGVAGNGYVFLVLYRLTRDKKYLYRASEFAKFLKSPKFGTARIPDSPYSLYEGYAGTICFLADLMEPTNASFPFMDIF